MGPGLDILLILYIGNPQIHEAYLIIIGPYKHLVKEPNFVSLWDMSNDGWCGGIHCIWLLMGSQSQLLSLNSNP